VSASLGRVQWLAPPGKRRPLKKALLVGLFAAALSGRRSLVPRRGEDQALVATGSGLMGAAAGAVGELMLASAARRLPGGRRSALVLFLAPAGAGVAVVRAGRRRGGLASAAESASLVSLAAVGAGEAAMQGYERLPAVHRVDLIRRAGAIAAAAAAAVLALRRKLAEPLDLRKASIAYPFLPSVSGGDGSAAPRATLDREGRKFLGLAASADAIGDVMGASAQDPIRVYVGLATAPTPEERVEAAVRELDRLGAFERKRVLALCPAGPGFVNPVPVEAEEYMSLGDVASVAVQYSTKRAHRAKDERPLARATFRLLLERLRDRLSAVDDDRRSELLVYGESLGAWIGAEIFSAGGWKTLDELRVDRAVLVGVPYWGAQQLALVKRQLGDLPSSVGVFTTADELAAIERERLRALRYVVFIHPEDPVSYFSGRRLLWERPSWLPIGPRHPRIGGGMWWMPGITWLQVLFDVKNATGSGPRFEAYAHDYRPELPAMLRVAFGHLDVSDEQVARIEEATVRSWEHQAAREAAARVARIRS
jgi:uncharacterized membrane protein